MDEADIIETPDGLHPAGPGWFVLNATQAAWERNPGWGMVCDFEPDAPRFADFGINLRVLEPGDVSTMYHGEEVEENFLVLAGECLAIIDGQERPLKAWDFLHLPAWVPHAFVGAGDGPCTLLQSGGRHPGMSEKVKYYVEPLAQRHGCGVREETSKPSEAYAERAPWQAAPYREGTLPGA